ncbi:acyl carrier protein [Kitasatospora xanthocidica]|uniref:acyl carrier protein n=1 Tax=Kitasatospora xanthocidica TaxID=83382 RepID=UPI0036E146B6
MAELTELTDLVADVLQVPAAEVTEETGAATTEAWTSLRQVQIVARAEQEYGVRLTAREARACRSVRALRDVLARGVLARRGRERAS